MNPSKPGHGSMQGLVAVAVATLLASGAACAITPTGDRAGPLPRSAKPLALAPTLPGAAPLELIGGTITAIDRTKQTMTVSGSSLAWHHTQLRVFGGNGVEMTERELAPGMKVRFALEPGSREGRAVVLIYVDATP